MLIVRLVQDTVLRPRAQTCLLLGVALRSMRAVRLLDASIIFRIAAAGRLQHPLLLRWAERRPLAAQVLRVLAVDEAGHILSSASRHRCIDLTDMPFCLIIT